MASSETGEAAAAPMRTASTAQALAASPEISLLQWPDTDTQREVVAASAGDVFGRGLQAKAEAACGSFQVGDAQATQSQLMALRNEVRAQQGKKLSAPTRC